MPDGATYDYTQDQAFLKAPPQQQHAYLLENEPEYAKADGKTQGMYIAHLRGYDQPTEHEKQQTEGSTIGGIARGAWETLKGMGKATAEVTPFPRPGKILEDIRQAPQKRAEAGKQWQTEKAAGYSLPYRIAAQTGIVDAPAMEEAARHGRTGEIIGRTAVPAAAAIAPLGIEAAGKVADVTAPARTRMAERIEAPIVKRPLGATMEDLRYGRDPKAAMVGEGITGSTPEAMKSQVEQKLSGYHRQADQTLSLPQHQAHVIDVGAIVNDEFTKSQAEARKVGEPALLTRLQNARDAMLNEYGPLQKQALDANNFKRQVGEQAKWTGQPFDNEVNGFRVNVYRAINQEIASRIPEVAQFNERSADLMSVKKALERKEGQAAGQGLTAAAKERVTNLGRTTIGKTLGRQYPALETPQANMRNMISTTPIGPSNAAPVGKVFGPPAAQAWHPLERTPPSGAGRTDVIGKTVEQRTAVRTPRPGAGERTLMAAPQDRPATTPAAKVPLTDAQRNEITGQIKTLETRARALRDKQSNARVWTKANEYMRAQRDAEQQIDTLKKSLEEDRPVKAKVPLSGMAKEEQLATYNSADPELKQAVDDRAALYPKLEAGEKAAFEREHNMGSAMVKGLPLKEKLARFLKEHPEQLREPGEEPIEEESTVGAKQAIPIGKIAELPTEDELSEAIRESGQDPLFADDRARQLLDAASGKGSYSGPERRSAPTIISSYLGPERRRIGKTAE